MHRTCIAVVDASRARLFEHHRNTAPEGIEDELVELTDLVNPSRRLRPSQLFSESSPGTNRAGNLQFGLDDHRSAHLDQIDATFADDIIVAISNQLTARPADRVILCSSPRMLGVLRRKLDLGSIGLEEVNRDLVKLTPSQLRDQLVSYGLLPARG